MFFFFWVFLLWGLGGVFLGLIVVVVVIMHVYTNKFEDILVWYVVI